MTKQEIYYLGQQVIIKINGRKVLGTVTLLRQNSIDVSYNGKIYNKKYEQLREENE